MPGPVFACLASKDKLQALRGPDFRALTEGRKDEMERGFLLAVSITAHLTG